MYKIVKEDMIAFLPKYTEYGDETIVYLSDGKDIKYKHNLKTFLIKIFKLYTIDRLAMKNYFRKIGIKEIAPIVLDGKIFIGFKIRKPRLKYDGAYGYVRVDAIDHIKPKPIPCLVLKNEREIPLLDSFPTATKNYCTGLYVDAYLNSDKFL